MKDKLKIHTSSKSNEKKREQKNTVLINDLMVTNKVKCRISNDAGIYNIVAINGIGWVYET